MLKYYLSMFILIFISLSMLPLISESRSNILASKTMYVNETHWINIRNGPTQEHKVVTRARSGEALTVFDEKDNWYYVANFRGEEGWVAKTLLKDEKPLADQVAALTSQTDEQAKLIARLSKENESLKKRTQLYESNLKELKHLKIENIELKNHEDLLWVVAGASIMFIGWIIGLLTASFYRRGKTKYSYSLD